MKTRSTPSSSITIGIDRGDRKHAICVLDGDGAVISQDAIVDSCTSLLAVSRLHPGAVLVKEVGIHRP